MLAEGTGILERVAGGLKWRKRGTNVTAAALGDFKFRFQREQCTGVCGSWSRREGTSFHITNNEIGRRRPDQTARIKFGIRRAWAVLSGSERRKRVLRVRKLKAPRQFQW